MTRKPIEPTEILLPSDPQGDFFSAPSGRPYIAPGIRGAQDHPGETPYHGTPDVTLRGFIQFMAYWPLFAGITMATTHVHAPLTYWSVIIFGIACIVWSAKDYERVHPGIWGRFFRLMGNLLGALLIILVVRSILEGLFGGNDDRDRRY